MNYDEHCRVVTERSAMTRFLLEQLPRAVSMSLQHIPYSLLPVVKAVCS
jgi:hypothetical protein